MSNTPNNQQQPDALAIALAAINDFDRSQLPPTLSSAGAPIVPPRDLYRRAALRVAYAQAAELRQQTALLSAMSAMLDSIETWLIDIEAHVDMIEDATTDIAAAQKEADNDAA